MSWYERAVIDRFEGKWAVLLVGLAGWALHVRRSLVPSSSQEGDWLRVIFADEADGQILTIEPDDEETTLRRKRTEEKVEKLRLGDHLT